MRASELKAGSHYKLQISKTVKIVPANPGGGYHYNWTSLTLGKDTKLECTQRASNTYGTYAQFKVISVPTNTEKPLIGTIVSVDNCSSVEKTKKATITTAPKSRKERAKVVRANIRQTKVLLTYVEDQVAFLKDTVIKLTTTADNLEQYDSDEEALAAALAKIVSTGGDPKEILGVLKDSGLQIGQASPITKFDANAKQEEINERFSDLELPPE